jgi:CRISPR-associated protein Cmr2
MRWVLALSIGPVGGFIAAGRRSRDLWYGSTWVSRTTVAVAERLMGTPSVELLLPTAARVVELHEHSGGRVSNKVLALVTADSIEQVRAIADDARKAARNYLLDCLKRLKARKELGELVAWGRFDQQCEAIAAGDFVEFSAAWVPCAAGDPFFGSAVARACDLRDASPKLFAHPSFTRPGVARSDLDEGRDSVLFDRPERRADRARAGIVESEELDAIGLLRRAGPYLDRRANGLPELPFAPLSRVAADPWIAGCRGDIAPLRELLDGARHALGEDFFAWCSPSQDPDPAVRFPFDASLLFEGGAEALIASVERAYSPSDEVRAKLNRALHDARGKAHALHATHGLPVPYYALVEADGDGIGRLLSEQRDQASYQKLVSALDRFAADAQRIATEHHATAIYVAGDELLAYAPLDKALALVTALQKSFGAALGEGAHTLSASVVFAHVKDDLRGVRRCATEALKEAAKKCGPGGLCVQEMPRAGAPRRVSGAMSELAPKLVTLATSIHEGHISLRTEQHLRDHLERFANAPPSTGVPPGVQLAQNAVRQQLQRSSRADATLQGYVSGLQSWDNVLHLADALRIASRIADVGGQRGHHEPH